MTIAKILVPFDFDEPSERALDQALALAATLRASVIVLHVYDYSFMDVESLPGSAMAPGAGEVRRRHAEKHLQKLVERRRTPGVALEGVLRQGAAALEIVNYTNDSGADLVVMGTHGRKGMRRMLLGSVAEEVVRTSPVPVMTVAARELAAEPVEAPAAES